MLKKVSPPGLLVVAALVAALASVLVGSARAANIAGTAKSDVLRGTAKADKLLGKGGNDKLYGLGGNDVLNGGPGNDIVVGGAGADTLACGPGRDTAMADVQDKPAADCETIKGIPKPDLSVADGSGEEENAGMKTIQFPVTLAKASPLTATVAFGTRDGTASAGTDYVAATGTLVFRPGETTKTISVQIVGDTAAEADETFVLALTGPVNAALARASATGTIANEDAPKPKPGRYNGTTSQNRTVAFTVNEGATMLSQITMNVDINCKEVPLTFASERFDLAVPVQVGPDGRFGFTGTDSDADGSITGRFDGGLAVSGQSSGTLRFDIKVNVPGGIVNCSTGEVTWTASPPA
jgi:hypothetical protein